MQNITQETAEVISVNGQIMHPEVLLFEFSDGTKFQISDNHCDFHDLNKLREIIDSVHEWMLADNYTINFYVASDPCYIFKNSFNQQSVTVTWQYYDSEVEFKDVQVKTTIRDI